VPPSREVDATSPAGAVVTYTPPTAKDPFDGGDLQVTCVPPSGSTFPIGPTDVDCSATTHVGTKGDRHFTITVKNHNPPVITVPVPGIVVQAQTPTGSIVNYTVSAKDFLGNSVPVTCAPASGTKFPLGVKVVNCSATDSSGNTGTASFTVQVRFGGFTLLPPVKSNGSSVFQVNQTIPVRFQLNPNVANAVANLFVAKIVNGVVGPEQPATWTAHPERGNLFLYDGHCKAYQLNMATKPLSAGTWLLRIDLHDGITHTVNITLKSRMSWSDLASQDFDCGCDFDD
jgi:hypothetical protein